MLIHTKISCTEHGWELHNPMIHGPPRKISDLYISPSQEKKNPCPLDLKI